MPKRSENEGMWWGIEIRGPSEVCSEMGKDTKVKTIDIDD